MKSFKKMIVMISWLACTLSPSMKIFADSAPLSVVDRIASKAPTSTDDVNSLVTLARSASGPDKHVIMRTLAQPDRTSFAKLGDSYLALLDDKDPDIRDAAVVACGNMNERRAVSTIRNILKSLPKHTFGLEVVMSKEAFSEEYTHGEIAAEALARMKDMESLPEILNRDTLAVSWSAIIPPYGASALPQVIEKARSNNARIKNLAEQTLISIHDVNAVPQLQTLLSDKDNSLRNTAVLALSQSDSPKAILSAEAAYGQLDDEGKGYFVKGCLKACDHQKAIKYFKVFMDNPTKAEHRSVHRLEAIMMLGHTLQSEAVPYLEGYLKDKDDGVREQAACELASITGRLYTYAENNTTRYFEQDCKAIQQIKQKR